MGPRSQMQVNPYYQCNVMQETYTPNDATEEIAVQEEEEMKSHRIRTPLQMSISCIFRLMQFQGWSLLAHFKSRSLLVDKQALPLLIPAVQVHSLICIQQLQPLAISKRKNRLKQLWLGEANLHLGQSQQTLHSASWFSKGPEERKSFQSRRVGHQQILQSQLLKRRNQF